MIVLVIPSFQVLAQEYNNLRKTFLQAEKYVWQAQAKTYKSLYDQLHYYPLQPYLDQQRLMHNIRLSDAPEIDAFLQKYKHSPLDWPLRKKWLNYLSKHKRKVLFLEHFKANNNAKLNCTYLQYQLDKGDAESTILKQVKKWWLVGKSQDKTCDPLFKKWIAAGHLTPDLVWQRIALAADGGKHTLIPYLTKLLPPHERYLGKLWHSVRRDPANVSRLNKFPNKNNKEVQILTYGLKRLIWRAPSNALKAYENVIGAYPFTIQQRHEITAKFAIALASKNHSQAQRWMDKVPANYLSKDLVQWRLAQTLKSQDWRKIQADLESLPKELHTSSQWQYWYGRSLVENDQSVEGTTVLAKLAQTRHYYGFLASSLLSQQASLQDQPLLYTDQEKQELLANPAAKRAFELFHLERFSHARKEWNFWLSQLTKTEKLIAATIAYEKSWFDRPIFTLANQGYLDDVSMRFPMAYEEKFQHYSDKVSIDTAWAMAISRRESSFMTDAYSGAGARGLMQIMPNTAKQLERRSVSKRYLLKADNNIKLGTRYLKQLSDKYQGNRVLATASYNAGPYRVKKWLTKLDDLPADIWIENIPFKETREYVKSVLAYQQIYQYHLDEQQQSVFKELIGMQIKQP